MPAVTATVCSAGCRPSPPLRGGCRRTWQPIPVRWSVRWLASLTCCPNRAQRRSSTVGQTVAAGQTLLLIEAMKTFNQIKAPKAGTVAAILVQNSSPVEYGEVLMILE